jgi:hypothetical protein
MIWHAWPCLLVTYVNFTSIGSKTIIEIRLLAFELFLLYVINVGYLKDGVEEGECGQVYCIYCCDVVEWNKK